MQRLFVMFPDRAPGLGLLVLRLGLGAGLLTAHGPSCGWLSGMAWAAALLLCAGWLTPLAALAAATALLLGATVHWGLLCVPLALLLLGPGAYSVDARRFGRRVLHKGPAATAAGSDPKE